MVQQLYSDIQKLKEEIRRLRGDLNRIAIGGKVITTQVEGTVQTPTAVEGAVLVGNSTPAWRRLVRDAPGAVALRNIIGLDLGDTIPSWKAMFSATNPQPIVFGQSAAPGTSLLAAHIDHVHGMDGFEIYIPFGYEGGGQAFIP